MSKKNKRPVSATNAALHKKNKSSVKHKNRKKKKDLSKKLMTNFKEVKPKPEKAAAIKPKDSMKKKNALKKKELSEKNIPQKFSKLKTSNYGAASSDSEPEPIEATWDVNVSEDKGASWKDADSASDTAGSQTIAFESSDDLEESESDHDEELDEHDLNSLILSNERRSSSSSEDEAITDDHDSSSGDDSSLPNRKKKDDDNVLPLTDNRHTKPQIAPSSKSNEEPPPKTTAPTTDKNKNLTLNDEKSLLEEIRRRAVDLASRSLYISPVPPDCSLERLRQLSSDIVSCRLSYNPVTKTCRKYAFLEYRDAEAAGAARKAISGRLFAGRNVSAQPGRPQFTQQSGDLDQVDRRQLFISGLHPTVTRADLHQVFPKAEVDYPLHSAGYPLGYAVAKFVNEAVALESFVKAHNHPVRGHAIFVNYVMRSHKPAKSETTANKSAAATKLGPAKAASTAAPGKTELLQTTTSISNSPLPQSKPTESVMVPQASVDNNSLTPKKPKVLIQPITDVGSDNDDPNGTDESDEADVHELFTKLRESDQDDDGTFLRKRVASETVEPPKPSNVLSSLFRMQKRNKAVDDDTVGKPKTVKNVKQSNMGKQLAASDSVVDGDDDSDAAESDGISEQDGDDEEEEEEEEDEEEGSDESDNEGSDEVSGDDDDDDDDDSDDAESEIEDDDDDADAAEVSDRIDEEDDESEASESSEVVPSALFSRPPTASERAALRQKPDASDEEIDDTLRAVMQSRRTAMRAVKTAGSKRPWAAKDRTNQATKKQQRSDLAKARKPFELPVPTKKQKL